MPSILRVGLIVKVALIVTVSTQVFPGSASGGSNPCDESDYAQQVTSPTESFVHGCISSQSEYFGWIGVNGNITTPSILAVHGTGIWHSVGYLSVDIGTNPRGWLQIGFDHGTISGCGTDGQCSSVNSPNSYVEYYEELDPKDAQGFQVYTLYSLGALPMGTGMTYRIEYAGTGGGVTCWNSYDHYNNLVANACHPNFPTSGAMVAAAETYDSNGNGSTSMPTAYFGVSALNTNQTLRIKGAAGYINWQPPLTSRYTQLLDNRCGSGTHKPNYETLGWHWYFRTYTRTTVGVC